MDEESREYGHEISLTTNNDGFQTLKRCSKRSVASTCEEITTKPVGPAGKRKPSKVADAKWDLEKRSKLLAGGPLCPFFNPQDNKSSEYLYSRVGYL